MKTITATSARNGFFNIIKHSVKTHAPCRITSRAGAVVLLSMEDFENLMETLELLSTPGVLKSLHRAKREIARGETYSLDEVFGS